MKKSQFTDQQIAFALQQAEGGTPVEEVCRKMGISQATFFRWKKVYGGLPPSEVRKLKQLQEENTRLRKLIADLTLRKEMLAEVIKKDMSSSRDREMIDFVRTCFRVSIRRACRGVPAARSTYHYLSVRPDQSVLRKRIREIAETRARYGYRRVHILLRREGWPVNVKRVRRLYNLESLQMRHKSPRQRVMAKLRDDCSNATGPN
jgi:putative transposase